MNNITNIIDKVIEEECSKYLWFIKYKGELIFPLNGIRGYKTKGSVINNFANLIYLKVTERISNYYFISEENYSYIANLLDIDIKLFKSFENETGEINGDKIINHLKKVTLPKLIEKGILEIVKL